MARSATASATKPSAVKSAASATELPLQGVTDAAFASLTKMGLGQYVAELEKLHRPEVAGVACKSNQRQKLERL